MATTKGIHISEHYVVSINVICLFTCIYTLCSEKMKGQTVFYI